MTHDTKKEFGKWRAFFWPVHGFELKKILPMFFMFFFISFNYTILRDTKDTLVVTSHAGAEAIPFLKFWGVLPCAIIFMLIYSKLSNMLSKPALFYTTIVPFLIFFGAFTNGEHGNNRSHSEDNAQRSEHSPEPVLKQRFYANFKVEYNTLPVHADNYVYR